MIAVRTAIANTPGCTYTISQDHPKRNRYSVMGRKAIKGPQIEALFPDTVYHNYKRAMESIGLPTARFHDLRYSYAATAIQSGDDIKTVQGNLGHATAAFTLDVYAHVTKKIKKAGADRMETYIKNVSDL